MHLQAAGDKMMGGKIDSVMLHRVDLLDLLVRCDILFLVLIKCLVINQFFLPHSSSMESIEWSGVVARGWDGSFLMMAKSCLDGEVMAF